ncbi:MAG: ribose-5-phosphate isomerase RpiA [Bacteroidota bacterium]
MNPKEIAGTRAAHFVKAGMTLGLGTGSTVYFTLMELGRMVRDGLIIQGVATSDRTVDICEKEGIPLLDIHQVQKLDLYLDGADEVDPHYALIKGGGGALFREKRVASLAKERVIIVDESKIVPTLGTFPLPVEVVPFGWQHVFSQIQSIGGNPVVRMVGEQFYHTDNGNYILDCHFGAIPQPEALHHQLKAMIGLVETGLFFHMAERVVVGKSDGTVYVLPA